MAWIIGLQIYLPISQLCFENIFASCWGENYILAYEQVIIAINMVCIQGPCVWWYGWPVRRGARRQPEASLLWEEAVEAPLLWWPGSWVLTDAQDLGRPKGSGRCGWSRLGRLHLDGLGLWGHTPPFPVTWCCRRPWLGSSESQALSTECLFTAWRRLGMMAEADICWTVFCPRTVLSSRRQVISLRPHTILFVVIPLQWWRLTGIKNLATGFRTQTLY